MKRKTSTLDAEFKRRNLIRPTQFFKTNSGRDVDYCQAVEDGKVEHFDWRGTEVWGVKS